MNKHSKGMSEMISLMDIKKLKRSLWYHFQKFSKCGGAPLRKSNGEAVLKLCMQRFRSTRELILPSEDLRPVIIHLFHAVRVRNRPWLGCGGACSCATHSSASHRPKKPSGGS